jgi:hypothetical protein
MGDRGLSNYECGINYDLNYEFEVKMPGFECLLYHLKCDAFLPLREII